MRYNIPCQIDVAKILQNTFKDFSDRISDENFNYDSVENIPICINGHPIGIITKDKDFLWLDITPEFTVINDKWNLMALNINLKDSSESFKLEYESKWEK